MLELMEDKETYLEQFAALEKSPDARTPEWLSRIRTVSMDRFAELGFPTVRDEEWRFTNITPLVQMPFKTASQFDVTGVELERLSFDAGPCTRLVFVNGRHVP